MHKLILWFFENLNNIVQTLSIICSFFIMMIVIYWLEFLINAQWNWMNFIKPVLNIILDFSNSIFPVSITAFGTVFDIKFITAVIILICIIFLLRFAAKGLNNIKIMYDDLHNIQKKVIENQFNKHMKDKVISEEIKISKYMVLIKTKIKKKFNHIELKIDINEQNNKINLFVYQNTGIKYEPLEDGFLYTFDDFNKIDNVLKILFKIIKSSSPIDYGICIQAGSDKTKLKKLSDLQYFGKIIISADTLLRYKCNKFHNYGTKNVGIFQQNDGTTIEVYEFHEIL